MKKLILALCAMCFVSCYRVDLDGQTECNSDNECEDGVECTLDYCGADNLCHVIDECVEPMCDPEIRTINLPTLGCGLDAASDDERIILAWIGCDSGERGNISLFNPLEPPEELTATPIEEPGNELRKPFVFWFAGENPRLFWTATSSDSAIMLTGEYGISESAVINRGEIWDSPSPATTTLNDVKLGLDGEYGLALEVRDPEIATAWFGRWSASTGFNDYHRLISADSRSPVLSPTETGWSLAYTVRGESNNSVYLTEFVAPDAFGEVTTIVLEPTMFATRAMVNAGGTAMVLYERYMADDINQLSAGWVLPDDTVMALDLDRDIAGVAGIDSSDDDPARASWCGVDLETGISSIHVIRLTTDLAETELWVDLDLTGCADTELIRVGDDVYALWLTNAGLSFKNLNCH
ncbi:MAG: hypothetical protein PHW53_01620 [Patescibacteria group bacterium]|nr:hypothetical protein [Patescibacteria group bacterium]